MVPQHTVTDVLDDAWWVGLLTFGVGLVATPVCRAVAYRTGVVDRPDALLKPHGRPVAYLGGVAMCMALLAGLVAYMLVGGPTLRPDRLGEDLAAGRIRDVLASPLWKTAAIALACLVITLVGLWDDLHDLRPRTKVAGQVFAGGLLLAGGVGPRMAVVFTDPFGFELPAWILLPVSFLLVMVTVVACCNATNLLDGLDGLCGGVTGIIAVGFLALATWLATWGRFAGTDELRIMLCLAMAGAVLGFLPYNIPPASIFMGDAGSMLLGFFVATMMILFCQERTGRWLVASLMVFALPVLDTSLAVVRRALAGRSIFAGDRSHLYDQLVDRGMSVRAVVILFYLLSAASALVGVTVSIYLRTRYAILIYVLVATAAWVTLWRLGMVRPAPRDAAPPDEPES